MATPEFILELRERVGTLPLWLSGVTAVVLDPESRNILLIRRSDTGEWTPVTGIIDPGEQPAVAAAREVLEEADVVVTVERVAGIGVTPLVVYSNGDQAQYLDIIFTCRWVSGEPRPADDEALEARWFPLDDLPPMSQDFQARVADGLATGPTSFAIAAAPGDW
ncbi:NUDIX domain-containing protein [soil metagenome]